MRCSETRVRSTAPPTSPRGSVMTSVLEAAASAPETTIADRATPRPPAASAVPAFLHTLCRPRPSGQYDARGRRNRPRQARARAGHGQSLREHGAGRGDVVHVARRRRPGQPQRVARVARDDVHVEMKHRLPGGRPVGLQEVDAVGTQLLHGARGDPLRRRGDRLEVLGIDLVHVARMRARDDERVAARRRVDVHEGERALVLRDDRRGDLAGDDLAEQAVGIGGHRAAKPNAAVAGVDCSRAGERQRLVGGAAPRRRSAPRRSPRAGGRARGRPSSSSAAASSSPRTSGARRPAARHCSVAGSTSRARSRCLAIDSSRLAPARRQPVGDRQQRDVDLDRLGGAQVAIQRAPRQRPLVDEEAEAQVVARERGDVRLQALAGAQAGEHVARELGAGAVVAEERRRAVVAVAERDGLGDVVQQRAEAQRERRGRPRRRAARRAARATAAASAAPTPSTATGSACSATVCSSTSSVWAWTSAWW